MKKMENVGSPSPPPRVQMEEKRARREREGVFSYGTEKDFLFFSPPPPSFVPFPFSYLVGVRAESCFSVRVVHQCPEKSSSFITLNIAI